MIVPSRVKGLESPSWGSLRLLIVSPSVCQVKWPNHTDRGRAAYIALLLLYILLLLSLLLLLLTGYRNAQTHIQQLYIKGELPIDSNRKKWIYRIWGYHQPAITPRHFSHSSWTRHTFLIDPIHFFFKFKLHWYWNLYPDRPTILFIVR